MKMAFIVIERSCSPVHEVMKVQIITASTANFTLVKKGLNYRRWYLNYQNVH